MNYTNDFVNPEPENTHPVLAKLYERIADLEKQVETLTAANTQKTNEVWTIRSDFANYKYKLENVLRTIAEEDESNLSAILEVAHAFDIELATTKTFRVVAEFDVSIEVPIGMTDFKPDGIDFWADLDYTGDGDFTIEGSSITSIDEI